MARWLLFLPATVTSHMAFPVSSAFLCGRPLGDVSAVPARRRSVAGPAASYIRTVSCNSFSMAATLIVNRSPDNRTAGEKRLAQRLEEKMPEECLAWLDIPVLSTHFPQQQTLHPDCILLDPRNGGSILIIEVKDYKPSTIQTANSLEWRLRFPNRSGNMVEKTVENPLQQARRNSHAVINALELDPRLKDSRTGKLKLLWGCGVVLTNISRDQFHQLGLERVLSPHLVLCKNEMVASVDPSTFQQRLGAMLPPYRPGKGRPNLAKEEVDLVRWIIFPEIRVPVERGRFTTSNKRTKPTATTGDRTHVSQSAKGNTKSLQDIQADTSLSVPSSRVMKVMDLQQENLARNLGTGHRVIHGVAGSGKTMILMYRAAYLARQLSKDSGQSTIPTTPSPNQILVLCYNKLLAADLQSRVSAIGISNIVQVATFHKWCLDQLKRFSIPKPRNGQADFWDVVVARVISAVQTGSIPSTQYSSILIDEAHDFEPEWLRLMAGMDAESLLVLYDDAQNIYESKSTWSKNGQQPKRRRKLQSLRSVGVQARGRSKILRVNYRNTQEILAAALRYEGSMQQEATPRNNSGIPLLSPIACARTGAEAKVIVDPNLESQLAKVADTLHQAQEDGFQWGDMAVLLRYKSQISAFCRILERRMIPYGTSDGLTSLLNTNVVKVVTIHGSKGLEFPVVAVAGFFFTGKVEAKLFFVGATRATDRLTVAYSQLKLIGEEN